MKNRYTVGTDFDGVIHKYDGDWQGADVIPGGPVDGAKEWLDELAAEYDIWVNSTRCDTEKGVDAVRSWLQELGLKQETLDVIAIGGEKRKCLIYVDDRGWRFEGDNFPTIKQIKGALPWWKKKK